MTNKNYIGVDIGGSKTEGVLCRDGKIVAVKRIPTPHTKAKFFPTIFSLISELSGGTRLDGVGFAVAGMVDYRRGLVLRNRHFRFFKNLPFLDIVRKKIKKPVKMDNDTKCFLLAEKVFGAARGMSNVVGLTLGTGLGGAVIVEGNMVRGRHHGAAQLTRMIIFSDRKEPLTFENLVSSHGFRRLGVTDPFECQRRALGGDKKCIAVYNQIGRFLGIGLANIANIFDPEAIIIGGGISKAGKLLLKPARKEMKKHAALPNDLPKIKISKLKSAGALGAVALFLK